MEWSDLFLFNISYELKIPPKVCLRVELPSSSSSPQSILHELLSPYLSENVITFSFSYHDRHVNQTDFTTLFVIVASPCRAVSTCFVQTVCSTVQAQLCSMHYSNTVASVVDGSGWGFQPVLSQWTNQQADRKNRRQQRVSPAFLKQWGTWFQWHCQSPLAQSRRCFSVKHCFDPRGVGLSMTEMDVFCDTCCIIEVPSLYGYSTPS